MKRFLTPFSMRMSVRVLMVVVLVVGGGLGWVAHRLRTARLQRDSIAAIKKVGGIVFYDWQFVNDKLRLKPGTNTISDEVPGWPKFLVDRLGVDCFGTVVHVSIRNHPLVVQDDADLEAALMATGRLIDLKDLRIPMNDDRLAYLHGLTKLESLMFRESGGVTDAGLVHLSRMTRLKSLYLDRSQISDKGMASLSGLSELETLNLRGTRITDAGLDQIGALKRLEMLILDRTQVSDAGIARFFGGRTSFKGLNLDDTTVGDAALQPLEHVSGLGWLYLRNTRVTDRGLAHLKGLGEIQYLDLTGTSVGDAGLAHLSKLTSLEHLILDGTRVTDGGLQSLRGLTRLIELRVVGTGVSKAGVDELRRTLPGVDIER